MGSIKVLLRRHIRSIDVLAFLRNLIGRVEDKPLKYENIFLKKVSVCIVLNMIVYLIVIRRVIRMVVSLELTLVFNYRWNNTLV
jgi:hypothetical protein